MSIKNKLDILRTAQVVADNVTVKFIIAWDNPATGAKGEGTAAYELAEAERICREADEKHPDFRHAPKPSAN